MEQNLNIAKILKNAPIGTKLYSPLFGNVYLTYIGDMFITVRHHSTTANFHHNGRLYAYEGTEPMLYPSKEMRDWNKFAWKRGDVLVNNSGFKVLFDKWANTIYTGFYAKIVNLGDSSYYDTDRYTLAPEDEAKSYIKIIEDKHEGKLNLETLEVKKPQPEFKDGNIVIQCVLKGVNVCIIKNCIDKIDNKYNYYARYNTQDKEINYDDWSYISPFAKFATDSERQQLFDALTKEGKYWDAEKKQIVDLKLKYEFKPFDKVLVRDDETSEWKANFYSQMGAFGSYECISGVWGDCIPYEGNEHLLGTTDNCE